MRRPFILSASFLYSMNPIPKLLMHDEYHSLPLEIYVVRLRLPGLGTTFTLRNVNRDAGLLPFCE